MTIDELYEHCKKAVYKRKRIEDNPTTEKYFFNEKIYNEHLLIMQTIEQLKEYQQLETDGRLVKLPCKVGDVIYEVVVNTDACYECADFEKGYTDDDYCENNEVKDEDGNTYLRNPQYCSDKLYCPKHFWEIVEYHLDNIDRIFNRRNDFGSTIFLTREEAEAKLAELRGTE